MNNDTTNITHPIILIGTGLDEMYNQLDSELKKTVSLTAGIEDSNMRASLNSKRNICKNTLRKLAKGLDVYPILFFVPSKSIKSDFLDYKNEEGIIRIKNFNSFIELLRLPQKNNKNSDIKNQLLNDEIFSALDELFDIIQSAKKNQLSQSVLKQKIFEALINFTTSLIE